MGIDMEKWPIGVSRGGLGGWQRRWSPHSENETIFVIWQAIFRRNVFDFSSPRLFIFRHNATELSASKKGRHKKHKRNKMSAALRWPQHKKKKKNLYQNLTMLVYMANSGGGCVSPNLLPFLMFRCVPQLTKHFSPNFQKACQSAGHWQLRWCGIFNRAATLKYIECITKSSSRSQLKSSSGLSFD